MVVISTHRRMEYRLLLVSLLVFTCYGLEDILHGDTYECIKCLCHSVTGCWSREKCGHYTIEKEYWMKAGSPRLIQSDSLSSDSAFKSCMLDENCVVHTIKKYTDDRMTDCNCDCVQDCKDRLAIHLGMGEKHDCINPYFANISVKLFNECAEKININLMEFESSPCHDYEC